MNKNHRVRCVVEGLTLCLLVGLSTTVEAAVVSDFTSGNDGWTTVDHDLNGFSGVLRETAIFATDPSPPTAGGRLLVQDLGNDWQYAIAPSKFLGNWSRYSEVSAKVTADNNLIEFPVVFYIADGRDGAASNAAVRIFDLTDTPASTESLLTASIDESEWIVTEGSWDALVGTVDEFWIRMDLTNQVALELDQLDDVRLKPVPLPAAAWLLVSALLIPLACAHKKEC